MQLAGDFGFSTPNCSRKGAIWWLSAIVLLSLGLRIASLKLFAGTIDWEGGEYARLAQNLMSGHGYVGLDLPGKNLMFPPLFPFAIAGVSFLTPDLESAARLVSIVAGSLLPIPVFLLARTLYSETVGYVAAGLVSVHPLLVHFSATACSEPFYLLLLVGAVYLSSRALNLGTAAAYALAGAVLGLAYLTRIEAAAFPVVVVFLAMLRKRWIQSVGLGKALRAALFLPLSFLLVSSPYIVWLHGETGQWRLEGKSPLNIETARRVILRGEDVNYAHYAVGPDLVDRGVWLKPAIVTIGEFRLRLVDLVQLMGRRASAASSFVWETMTGKSFGTPIVFGLVILGLVGLPWKPGVSALHLLMLAIVSIACLQTTLIIFENVRFLLVPLPFLLGWAAAGAIHLLRWLHGAMESLGERWVPPRLVANAAVGLLLSLAFGVAYRVAHTAYPIKMFDRSTLFVEEIGRRLSSGVESRVRLAEASTAFSYYADADWIPLPYCDSDTALRYFEKKQVSHIALRESLIDARPYLRDWMASGIPSPRAELVQEGRSEAGERFRIYRWHGQQNL